MTPTKEITGIQYLRAVAALLVVLDHSSGMIGLGKYYGVSPFGSFLEFGSIGVDLFFCISGFIIIHTTCPDISAHPKISPQEFVKRRFIRIIPFLWLCVISYGLLKYIGRGNIEIAPYLRSLILLPIGDVQPNSVWTLRHEFLFYLLCLSLFSKSFFRYLLLPAWGVAPIIQSLLSTDSSTTSPEIIRFLINPLNILFLAGGLVAILTNKKIINIKFKVPGEFVIIASTALIPIAYCMDYSRLNTSQVELMSAICALILILATYSKDISGKLGALASLIGNASYAIYLTHEAIISATLGILSKSIPIVTPHTALLITSLVSIALGIIIHKKVENPLINQLKYRLAKK